jgi:glycosyl transferase family 1
VKNLLVIAPDVPYPDDYGGAKDMWHRLQILHEHGHGLSLIAAYWQESRRAAFEASPQSKIFRDVVLFRSSRWRGLATLGPYAVGSRRLGSAQVEQAASRFGTTAFDAVEIEGLQAVGTFLSVRRRLRFRKALVRPFNRESAYQFNQARSEPRLLQRTLLRGDACRFYLFERFGRWKRAVDAILFISGEEFDHPSFGDVRERALVRPPIPARPPPAFVNDFARRENTLLYVGNLKLPDNRAAVRLVYRELRELLHRHDWRFAVCGHSDDSDILRDLRSDPRVTCAFNLTAGELEQRYARAKVFTCFSENRAGAKLKLFEPILAGLPVVANDNAVAGSALRSAVLMFDHGDAEARRTLEDLLTNASRWQDFRVAAYRAWRRQNESATAEYLQAFD